ncbi:hypothetical protein N7466_009163 [Penicillium verhagenii]|uniref:uncharacterized protein n=1 Tax=Penicillium verhagenii TaxID=1562060 RepID=UPI00254599BD|nr:uncharacterized protein N7466_009163 [Penicillium verhagenii]KAJ5920837.1 hypothetical protein N7466_009163 [Penicillium verhagenii]
MWMQQAERGQFVCDATVARSAAISRLDQMEFAVGVSMKGVIASTFYPKFLLIFEANDLVSTLDSANKKHFGLHWPRPTLAPRQLEQTLPHLSIRENPQNLPLLTNKANEVDLIIQTTQASLCPPTVICQALADFYFCELFHWVPVLDRGQEDLEKSLLLRQSLYFAGSGMRRSTEGPTEWSTLAIFKRIKILISINHELAPLNILSALCILASYPIHTNHEVALDNPWQWGGTAIRLALQMHMHEENAYLHFDHPKRARRIWWYLFMNDTMQMGCSGLPGMFPLGDSNVRLPTIDDFNTPSAEAHVFCAMALLCQRLREVLQIGKSDDASQMQVFSRLDLLRVWQDNLSHELHLFDEKIEIRRSYNRAVAELYIFYMVTIILTCFLGRRENCPLLKCASIVASSCISRLYEEILYHEGTTFLLPIHAWANLVASIPRTFSTDEQIPNQANEKRISRMVLEKMSEKHPSVMMVQQRIDEMSHAGASVFGTPDTPPDAPNLNAPLTTETSQQILSLFPFPSSFCPTLDLFSADLNESEQPDIFADLLIDVNNWDWPVDWSSFLF